MTDDVIHLDSRCFRHHMAFLNPVHPSHCAFSHMTFTEQALAVLQCFLTIKCIHSYLFVDVYACIARIHYLKVYNSENITLSYSYLLSFSVL